MATNIQGSVPLPVIMPFPMIPFDDRYPILLTPNGKPKKGREKKKDPKGETEDETDKDVDDEKDEGGKEYKAMGSKKVDPGPDPTKVISKDDGNDDEEDEDEQSKTQAAKNTNKQLKVVFQENGKEDENDEEDKADSQQDDKEAYDKDTEEDDGGEDNAVEESGQRERLQEDKEANDQSEDEDENENEGLKTEAQNLRNKRAIYNPIIGHPEDIMPYIMLGNEEQDAMDVQNDHKVTTRDAEQQQNPSERRAAIEEHGIRTRNAEDENEKSHVIITRDVDAEDEEAPHGITTRDVNTEEEDEEEAHDMRPRSLPDGRSYETVTYHKNIGDRTRIFQKFLQ